MIDVRLPRRGRLAVMRLESAPGSPFGWHASLHAPSGKTMGVARKTLAGTLAELAVHAREVYLKPRVVLWGSRAGVDLAFGSRADLQRSARLTSAARHRQAMLRLAGRVDGIAATFGVNVAQATKSFRRLERVLADAQRPPHLRK